MQKPIQKQRLKYAIIKGVKLSFSFTIIMYLLSFIPLFDNNHSWGFHIVFFIVMFLLYFGFGYFEYDTKKNL